MGRRYSTLRPSRAYLSSTLRMLLDVRIGNNEKLSIRSAGLPEKETAEKPQSHNSAIWCTLEFGLSFATPI